MAAPALRFCEKMLQLCHLDSLSAEIHKSAIVIQGWIDREEDAILLEHIIHLLHVSSRFRDVSIDKSNIVLPFTFGTGNACSQQRPLTPSERLYLNAERPSTGETLLHEAVRTGNIASVCFMIRNGANVHATSPKTFSTPLLAAICHPRIVSPLAQSLFPTLPSPSSSFYEHGLESVMDESAHLLSAMISTACGGGHLYKSSDQINFQKIVAHAKTLKQIALDPFRCAIAAANPSALRVLLRLLGTNAVFDNSFEDKHNPMVNGSPVASSSSSSSSSNDSSSLRKKGWAQINGKWVREEPLPSSAAHKPSSASASLFPSLNDLLTWTSRMFDPPRAVESFVHKIATTGLIPEYLNTQVAKTAGAMEHIDSRLSYADRLNFMSNQIKTLVMPLTGRTVMPADVTEECEKFAALVLNHLKAMKETALHHNVSMEPFSVSSPSSSSYISSRRLQHEQRDHALYTIMKLLLERGADPNAIESSDSNSSPLTSFKGYTALQELCFVRGRAVTRARRETIKMLIEAGGDPISNGGDQHPTALLLAIENQNGLQAMLLDYLRTKHDAASLWKTLSTRVSPYGNSVPTGNAIDFALRAKNGAAVRDMMEVFFEAASSSASAPQLEIGPMLFTFLNSYTELVQYCPQVDGESRSEDSSRMTLEQWESLITRLLETNQFDVNQWNHHLHDPRTALSAALTTKDVVSIRLLLKHGASLEAAAAAATCAGPVLDPLNPFWNPVQHALIEDQLTAEASVELRKLIHMVKTNRNSLGYKNGIFVDHPLHPRSQQINASNDNISDRLRLQFDKESILMETRAHTPLYPYSISSVLFSYWKQSAPSSCASSSLQMPLLADPSAVRHHLPSTSESIGFNPNSLVSCPSFVRFLLQTQYTDVEIVLLKPIIGKSVSPAAGAAVPPNISLKLELPLSDEEEERVLMRLPAHLVPLCASCSCIRHLFMSTRKPSTASLSSSSASASSSAATAVFESGIILVIEQGDEKLTPDVLLQALDIIYHRVYFENYGVHKQDIADAQSVASRVSIASKQHMSSATAQQATNAPIVNLLAALGVYVPPTPPFHVPYDVSNSYYYRHVAAGGNGRLRVNGIEVSAPASSPYSSASTKHESPADLSFLLKEESSPVEADVELLAVSADCDDDDDQELESGGEREQERERERELVVLGHRIVLAQRCPFISTLLLKQDSGSSATRLRLRVPVIGATAEERFQVLSTIVKSLYCGVMVGLREETAVSVLVTADQLLLPSICRPVSDYLWTRTTMENVVSILSIARTYSQGLLELRCISFIVTNYYVMHSRHPEQLEELESLLPELSSGIKKFLHRREAALDSIARKPVHE